MGFDVEAILGYNDVFSSVFEKHSLLAVFGYGSYFRKNRHGYGDIDIIFVVDDDVYYKYFTVSRSNIFDVTVVNTALVRNHIARLHQFFLRSISSAEILYDVESHALALKSLAIEKFCSPRPELLKKNSLVLIRSRVRTLLLDMKNNLVNKVLFDLVFCSLISSLRDVVCLINNDWATTYSKDALAQIRLYDSISAELLEKAFSHALTTSKYEVAERVALSILAPVGGLLQQDEIISLKFTGIVGNNNLHV